MISKFIFEEMRRVALAARRRAYAPYSGFKVGAAVLAGHRRIFGGANIENASYGLSICAERSAITASVNAGARRLRAVLVAAPGAAAPCGACLQVIAEFAAPECPVCLIDPARRVKPVFLRLRELLPRNFHL